MQTLTRRPLCNVFHSQMSYLRCVAFPSLNVDIIYCLVVSFGLSVIMLISFYLIKEGTNGVLLFFFLSVSGRTEMNQSAVIL